MTNRLQKWYGEVSGHGLMGRYRQSIGSSSQKSAMEFIQFATIAAGLQMVFERPVTCLGVSD
jgi:hypothetical protein